MTPQNILHISNRNDFRDWLIRNSAIAKECWIAVKRGKTPPVDALWYLDAVEEALCFRMDRFNCQECGWRYIAALRPANQKGRWTELNKERCRRLDKLGLMTDKGRSACPDLDAEFVIDADIIAEFEANPVAWSNFRLFPALYQRVRIDNIQANKSNNALFTSRLTKLINASESGVMIGDWHDCGRLLDY